jgi:hypothetical protein
MRKRPGIINNARAVRFFSLLLIVVATLKGQEGGWIAGVVHDRSGAVVPGAEVRIQSEATGARQKVYCDAEGRYGSALLASGFYKITIRRGGFRTVAKPGITVQSGKTRIADFLIDILPIQQEVTVEANHDSSDPNANGLTVSRDSPQSALPVNGRDLHALYPLLPGAVMTPAPTSDGGQFSVTGQRATTNSFRVDGISGNAGIGFVSTPGPFPGTTLPGMTTIGSTHSLASQEETQRVDLKPLNFAPENGERPGAQISVETRTGSNEFHGSALGYIRPSFLNSRDWFAQKYSVDLPSASLNGWGASLGGPILRNKTFFFAALERTDVDDTALRLFPVPSLTTRNAISSAYQPFLAAFPLPIGPALNSTEALGAAPLLKIGAVSNNSLRLDQLLGNKIQLFARYTTVPSSATTTNLDTFVARFQWMSATGGLNAAWGNVTQQLRFNYSRAVAVSAPVSDQDAEQSVVDSVRQAFYGFKSLSPFGIYSIFNGSALQGYLLNDITVLSLAGAGQIISGPDGRSSQGQLEETYNLSVQVGRHEFRAGADYIRLHANPGVGIDALSLTAGSTEALLAGNPLAVTISDSSLLGPVGTKTFSAFAQDALRLSERLTVLYGLRYEVTPPPSLTSSFLSTYFPYVGYWSGAGTTPVPIGQNLFYRTNSNWSVNYAQLAPRLGIAYHWKKPDLMLRGGGGTFFDTSFASAINASNANISSNWQFFPLRGVSSLASGATPIPALNIPRIWEWRTAVEKSVRPHSSFSLSYIGSKGRDLLRKEASLDPQTSLLQAISFTNHGRSDYQALQAQFTGNLAKNLYALVSYTWSHSIDTGSRDTAVFLTYPGYSSAIDRGSSNFDIRHALNTSLEYRLPRSFLKKWIISSTFQARTGFPFDVTTVDRSIGLGFDNTSRPDVVPGVPFWLPDSAVPGGRQLNPAAFRVPPNQLSGTLGRNVLNSPGLLQVDVSLRRQWKLYRGSSLEGSLSTFNAFNRASFANPVSYLGSALFGQPASMTNLMLGSGTPTTGLTPLFQAGGPRTVELNLKFSF